MKEHEPQILDNDNKKKPHTNKNIIVQSSGGLADHSGGQ